MMCSAPATASACSPIGTVARQTYGSSVEWINPLSKWSAGTSARCGIHPVPGKSPELCTEQLSIVGPWHERLPHFRPSRTVEAWNELQSEVFLPRSAAQKAVARAREIGSRIAPALLVSEMRTVRADDLWLSPSYGRDSVAFHFTWTADESAALPAIAAIQEPAYASLPAALLGQADNHAPAPDHCGIRACSRFARLMVEYDPTFKFRNDFVSRLFPRC